MRVVMRRSFALLLGVETSGEWDSAEQRDSAWIYCWENGHSAADCCKASADCFDSIFTRAECCADGWARLFPTADPEPPAWELAADWSRASFSEEAGRGEAWLQHHPSLSRAQRLWERAMANASVLLSEDVLGVPLRLHAFKRAGPAFGSVLRELQEDVYRLQRAAPPGPGATVVDVGASIGMVAVLLAKLWPGARVLAVEPAPANFRYLLWNIRENGVMSQVWPLNVAVGAAPALSQTFFYSPTYPTWSQACGQDCRDTQADGEESWRGGWTDWQVRFEVEAVTLAELLAALGLGDVHLLKVDCEGCEWALLSPPVWPRLRHRVAHVTAELHLWALESTAEAKEVEASVREAVCRHETGGHLNEENLLCSTV